MSVHMSVCNACAYHALCMSVCNVHGVFAGCTAVETLSVIQKRQGSQ